MYHHHHHLICKQLKQKITTVQYVKDSRYNQPETAPTVALDTTNTSTEHLKTKVEKYNDDARFRTGSKNVAQSLGKISIVDVPHLKSPGDASPVQCIILRSLSPTVSAGRLVLCCCLLPPTMSLSITRIDRSS